MARKPSSAANKSETLEIRPPRYEAIRFLIMGLTPLIYHNVSMKSKRELLLPRGPLNAAAKAANLKHDPILEYRESVYQWDLPESATRLMVPAMMFKAAMMSAALRTPGVARTEIGELVTVSGELRDDSIAMFGTPMLRMDNVRMSDIARTLDVRTRATLPEWCCEIKVRYMIPYLTASAVGNLLATAGLICGIGDYRQGKGKGSYGQFELVDPSDAKSVTQWNQIASRGKLKQDAALADPDFYDLESENLYMLWEEDIKKRGRVASITQPYDHESIQPEFTPKAAGKPSRKGNGAAREASL